MSKGLTDEEHQYFHQLIFVLTNASEPKFTRCAVEHRSKGNLWDMSDVELDKAIHEEMIDLIMYYSEKLRRAKGK